MSDLLLAETPSGDGSDTDPVWPQTTSRSATWAHDLHDELERGTLALTAELTGRIASWLRVQALGRQTVCVVEPRMATFAAAWNAAAAIAGLSPVRLRRGDGSIDVQPPVAAKAMAIEPVHAANVTAGWRHRTRLWLADRSEGAARTTIRAIQR